MMLPFRRFGILLSIAVLLLGCNRGKRSGEAAPLQARVVTRTIQLFYESADLRLVAESRTLPLPESDVAAAPVVVRELLKGSVNKSVPPLFPPGVIVRGTYTLPDGTAVVDLGGQVLVDGWQTGSHAEMMALYSVVQTLTTNFSEIRRVRFVVNGQPADTLAGHVDLRKPLRPLAFLTR
jgi:hypothetical protein